MFVSILSSFIAFVFNKKELVLFLSKNSIPSKMSEKCSWVKRDKDVDVEIYVVRH